MSKYYLWLANTAIVLVCMMLLACAPAPDPRIGQLEARVKSLETQLDLWTALQTNGTARIYETLHEHMKLIGSVQDIQGRDHQMISGLLDDYERLLARATNRPARKD